MAFIYFVSIWISLTVVGAARDDCLVDFNSADSLCCDGKVINHQYNQFGCFNHTQVYDRTKKGICGGSLFRLANGRNSCFQDREVFDTRERMVCGRALVEKVEGHTCCGNYTMNPVTEECCPVRDQYLPLSPEECCLQRTEMTRSLDCCAGAPYDKSLHLCCAETLFPATGTNQCLGDAPEVYDELTHILIGDSAEPITNGKADLCDTTPYDSFSEKCNRLKPDYPVERIGSEHGELCGNEPYNKETATCCHGNRTIHLGFPEIGGLTACSLMFEPYLISDTLDCEGKLEPRSADGLLECCGRDVLNISESRCCSGEIVDKPSLTTKCCGISPYESLTQTCLKDYMRGSYKIVEGVYDASKTCGTDILGENEFCFDQDMFLPEKVKGRDGDNALCGRTPYNDNKFVCSKQKLYPKVAGTEVCAGDGVLFDTSKWICCFDRLFPKYTVCGENVCCGSSPYKPDHQTCSPTNSIIDVPSNVSDICGMTVYDTSVEEMCDEANDLVVTKREYRKKPHVCWVDNQPIRFDNRSDICCGNKLVSIAEMKAPACCADKVYDASLHICCGSVLHDTFGVPMKCEGAIAYSDEQQVCDGMVHNKTSGECCGAGVFNPANELCCQNKVKLTKSAETESCCGYAKYNVTDPSKLCCGGKTLHRYLEGYECCGTSLIDPQVEICLNEEVAISRDFESSTCDPIQQHYPDGTCCGGLLYVGQFGTCDGLRFVRNRDNPLWCGNRLMEDGEECCGTAIFSTNDSTCIDGTVVPLCADREYDPATHACCNNKVIDTSERICCSDRVRRIENGENSCCERVAYDNSASICCKGRVRRLDEPTLDLDKCCPRGQTYHLSLDECVNKTESACGIDTEIRRPKIEIKKAACSSVFHARFVVRGLSSSSRDVSVRMRPLQSPCPHCDESSNSKQALRGVHTLTLPEGCTGIQLELNRKYLVLSSSAPVNGSLDLTRDALILRSKATKVVVATYDEGGCA